ncbi:hypothetical protein BMS3Abin03_03153 [bacterium BMS3Abin03]|nr:hypothetical protein BMS3Abin03_03153 [bacterium BMS3Abin03]
MKLKLVTFVIIIISSNILPQQSKLSKAVNYLSDFIASDNFLQLKTTNSDLALVDSIYLRAVAFTENDYSEALLALTFTTIPYNEVPIILPLIKSIVYFPLISADDSTYNLKNKNLPTRLFFDTPNTVYGDRDKLAHFFGNAFIGYSENIFDLSNLIGYFVESFEESFKVQSKVDYRDLDVNRYGDLFGKLLQEDKKILPSQVMLIRSLSYIIIIL